MKRSRVADRRCAVLVHGDADLGQMLVESLAPELDVHCVRSIHQASLLLGKLERVDLAFLDLELAGSSGDELLETFRSWPDAIRVLLARSWSSHESALKNRHLAHLVLGNPPGVPALRALKSAVLGLSRG